MSPLAGVCKCVPRILASSDGTFAPHGDGEGWVFKHDHLRKNGEPMRWHDCPFCGVELPNKDSEFGDPDGWRKP